MSRILVVMPLISIALLVTGCTASKTDNNPPNASSTPETPSIAVSVKPAPTQYNQGRRSVNFDPCTNVGDAVVSQAGFDPSTRERNDEIHDSYSFIGCKFDHQEIVRGQKVPTRTLTISSTNITLDEFRKREGASATEIKVNGRDAITYNRPDAEACFIVMKTNDGSLDVQTSVSGPFTSEKPCDRIRDVAGLIEPTLGLK
ncbi:MULTISPECIES: DUF3558 domain-containing protein [unclassified Nocardia]|uniref:DUF3558 domain-containing protein n=1 Tax=unclassified Nocardia TaxID=2637762 RepID=UPI001CE4A4E2|nr:MULTISPECIES: DUF3558 domain-containing protein [unclassified Nocardia]